MSDPLEDLVKALYDGLVTAQMTAMSAQFIARELIVDVAKLQPDPEKYITNLYDRAIAHVDKQLPDDGAPEKEVTAQTRDIVGALFRDALKALQTPMGNSSAPT